MRPGHALPVPIDDEAGQKARVLPADTKIMRPLVGVQLLLDPLPEFRFDDRFMRAGVRRPLMHDLAAINAIPQHEVQGPARDRPTSAAPAARIFPALAQDALAQSSVQPLTIYSIKPQIASAGPLR